MSFMFELKDISKTFALKPRLFKNPGGRRIKAVDGVSLGVRRGEIAGLVGESGCGKTTLANILLLLQQPDAGEVLIGGERVTGLRGYARLYPVRRKIQAVFQNSGSSLDPMMNLEKIITEPLRYYRLPHKGQAERLLQLAGLPPEWVKRRPSQLSGGQRQRVSIARALALSPEILVLDEPTASLDILTAQGITGLLKSINQEQRTAMLFISHDIALAERFCTTKSVMLGGKIVETLESLNLENASHPYTRKLLEARLSMGPPQQGSLNMINDEGEKK